MATSSLLPSAFLGLLLLLSTSTSSTGGAEAAAVLTLDAGNFSEAIAAHQFIVVNFYAPWCYWSNKLAPEYEKAASILRNHDPPIVLAKIDDTASSKNNKDCRDKYRVLGYPTIMFLRNGGSTVQEYLGARDAESIVRYLKKQVGSPASAEMSSAEDAASSTTDDNGMGKITDDTLESYHETDPISALNDQLVKKVSPNNLHGVLFNSAEKVLFELKERMKWACQILVAAVMEIFTKHG